MRDDQIVFQIVRKVCDLAETFTLHDDKSADHSFFRIPFASGISSRKFKIQCAEKVVIEFDNALGCEKAHILNQFLSVDCGQPLSGWFCLVTSLYQIGAPLSILLSDF